MKLCLKLIIILVSTITHSVYAQNQTLLAIPYATKNLVRDSVVSPVRRAIAKSKIKKMNEESVHECRPEILNNSLEINNLEDFITDYSEMCRPWGEDKRCDCDLRCPEDFSIFDSPFYKGSEVAPQDDLAFRNDPDDFDDTKQK